MVNTDKELQDAYDYLAPDGSEIRLLSEISGGGLAHCTLRPGGVSRATRVRRKGRLPAEAARAADRPAVIGPTDATLPIGMETALSMARLGAMNDLLEAWTKEVA